MPEETAFDQNQRVLRKRKHKEKKVRFNLIELSEEQHFAKENLEQAQKLETFEQKRRRLKVNYFEGGQNIYKKLASKETTEESAKKSSAPEKDEEYQAKKAKPEKAAATKEPKRETKQKRKDAKNDDLLYNMLKNPFSY